MEQQLLSGEKARGLTGWALLVGVAGATGGRCRRLGSRGQWNAAAPFMTLATLRLATLAIAARVASTGLGNDNSSLALFDLSAGPPVLRRPWSSEALERAIAQRRVQIFTGSPAESWPGRARWGDPQHFLSNTAPPLILGDVAAGAVNWNWDPGMALCNGNRDGCSSAAAPACRGEAVHQRPWRNVTAVRFFKALRNGRPALYYSPIERELAAFAPEVDFSAPLDVLDVVELQGLRRKSGATTTASEKPLQVPRQSASYILIACGLQAYCLRL